MGSSAPPRTCSSARGRLAKNIPVRVTVVAAGIDEDIQTRERVNTFFDFFEKNFGRRRSVRAPLLSRRNRIARSSGFYRARRAMIGSQSAPDPLRGQILCGLADYDWRRALRESRNCTITSKARGSMEMTMIPSTTVSKCDFTHSIWPKITPEIIMRKTQRKLPTTV